MCVCLLSSVDSNLENVFYGLWADLKANRFTYIQHWMEQSLNNQLCIWQHTTTERKERYYDCERIEIIACHWTSDFKGTNLPREDCYNTKYSCLLPRASLQNINLYMQLLQTIKPISTPYKYYTHKKPGAFWKVHAHHQNRPRATCVLTFSFLRIVLCDFLIL